MTDKSLPLVSVGLPTFNRASSLTKAVNSVLQQTYPNIQLIISDNASTDETQSICEKFSQDDQRVTYIRQKANLGAANNFTEVLEQSTGDYFMWLGDDDWIDDEYIFECVSVLISNPEYSLVAGKAEYFTNENFKYQGNIINLQQEDAGNRLLSYYSQVSDNGVFYGVMRRDQISQIPMKNTMGGDWLMIATMAFLGKVKTLLNTSVNRHVRENDSYEKLAAKLGVSKFQGKYPMLSIVISASKDIFNNKNYQSISFMQKVKLSCKIIVNFLLADNPPSLKYSFIVLVSLHTPKLIYPQVRSIYNFFKLINSRPH